MQTIVIVLLFNIFERIIPDILVNILRLKVSDKLFKSFFKIIHVNLFLYFEFVCPKDRVDVFVEMIKF